MSHSFDTEAFLARLYARGIRLWWDGEKLRCSGPRDALTADITRSIREHRLALEAFTRQQAPRDKASKTIPVRPSSGPAPLSFAQRRLWFVQQLLPTSAQYNMPFAYEVTGPLQPQALQKAVNAVVARHDILRTQFAVTQGEPRQIINDQARVVIEREAMEAPSLEQIQSRAFQEAQKPFDLNQAPLLRVRLIAVNDQRHFLLVTAHHIIADGWSLGVFTRELGAAYGRAVQGTAEQLPALPVQYADYAHWQTETLVNAEWTEKQRFWQSQLAGELPATELPTDCPRVGESTQRGSLVLFNLSNNTRTSLKTIARQHGSTLFATLLTLFYALLYRYTGQTDLVIGTPVANRERPELENMIGLFVNPVVVRCQLQPHKGLFDNLQRVQSRLRDIHKHQDFPFEKLVELFQSERDLARHPFFQIKFQFDNAEQRPLQLPDLNFKPIPKTATLAKLDLSLDLTETSDGIAGAFEFNTDLFKRETIERLASHFCRLVASASTCPDAVLADWPMLSADEIHQQLVTWNDSQKPFAHDRCFHHLFEAQLARRPDDIALIYDNTRDEATYLSYRALDDRANQLANWLISRGIGPEQVVAICLPRSVNMVVAMLAVFKAGGAYLPLDPTYPRERLRYMLSDARAAILLSQSDQQVLPANQRESLERLDLDTHWPENAPVQNPQVEVLPHNLAYLMYTSGSTGRPKGVQIQHRGLVNLTEDKVRVCDVRPQDCVLQFFSFSFDASVPELVMSLAAGARLLLSDAQSILPGPPLRYLLETHRVSHLTMTPSALWRLPQSLYRDLRMVLVGGEAPSAELVQQWSGGRRVINAYGPTEITVNASMVSCGNGAPVEPTVQPSANKHLLILDDNLQLLPVGVPGELHVSGVGLARGYRHRPDLTAARFVPNPFAQAHSTGDYQTLYKTGDLAAYSHDGRIRILGRLDQQTKIRGYRIELTEIERALDGIAAIKTAFVLVREDTPGDKRIVVYAVPAEPDTQPGLSAIKAALKESIPPFMLPSAVVWLAALPLTVNGKVDTAALPAPSSAARDEAFVPPRSEVEKRLAAIFADILQVESVGIHDDFFDLGGHSLLATQLVARCLEAFATEITLLELFRDPTVAGLAATVDAVWQPDAPSTGHHSDSPDSGDDRLLRADLELDDGVRPPAQTWTTHSANILLTGATGFIGSYLLRELLEQTTADIHCLVRLPQASTFANGLEKIRGAMTEYGLWREHYLDRIFPVIGDLAQPQLGLSDSLFEQLATRMDCIYHNGAYVHHMMPYAQLKPTNVRATKALLKLAAQTKTKYFHYISTLSVLPTQPLEGRSKLYESDPLHWYPAPAGTYNRSKWVAEQLVSEAGRRGLPITIHRPGPVSGDSQTGAFNRDDILCQLMLGYIELGCAPDGDIPLDMLPVDYLARVIVYIARQPDSLGQTFHHIHTHPISSQRLFDVCNDNGFAIDRVPYRQWHRQLLQVAQGDATHPLYPLVGLFTSRDIPQDHEGKDNAAMALPFDTTHMENARRNAPFEQPALSERLLQTYLRALVKKTHLSATAAPLERY